MTITADPPVLSDRQTEILQLIVDGHSTKQAARRLGITTKTVHNHLNKVYATLGADSMTHAVVAAARLGIVDLDR